MEKLFLTLLNMGISAGWIAIAVLLLRLLLFKMPKWFHCLLWVPVGLRLLIPVFPSSAFSFLPSARVIPETVVQKPVIQSGITFINDTVNPILTQTEGLRIARGLELIFILWAIGVTLLLLYGIISYIRLRLCVRVCLRTGEGICLCDSIDTPFILGILRPKIYVPSCIPSQQLDYVVAHEKAHLRRGDHLWKPLGFALLCLYWFHPAMWAGYLLLCRDIEKACDEKVIRDMDGSHKRNYSEALLACSIHSRQILACPLAFGEVAVKDRIRNILNYKRPTIWVVIAAVVVSLLCGGWALTDPLPCSHRYQTVCAVQASCTEEGLLTHTCSKCWDSYSEPTAVLPHDFGDSFVSVPATCIQEGQISATCASCGQTHVVETVKTNDIHRMTYSVIREATCGTEGLGRNTCADCGCCEDAAIALLEHTYREGIVLSYCDREGSRQMICTGCGKEQWYSIPKSGAHSYIDGINGTEYCVWCGYTRKKEGSKSSDYSLLDGVIGQPSREPTLPVIQWAPEPGNDPGDFSWLYP